MNQQLGWVGKVSLWIALGLTGILVFLAWVPIPKSQTVQQGNATVALRVNRQIVPFANSCVQYGWDAEQIQAIWWNDSGTIGSNQTQYCTPSLTPSLRVEFTDGTQTDYALPVIVLTQNTVARWAALSAIGLYLLAFLIWIVPRLGNQQSSLLGFVRVVELIAIWIVIGFIILEGGTRLWLRSSLSEIDQLAYFGTQNEIIAAANQFIDVPYVHFILSPDANNDTVNNMGFRGDAIALDKPEETYRIITLGGSTTYGYQVDVNETWSVLLQKSLREDYGYDQVEVVNAGVPMYSTFESYVNFSYRGLELDPDMVIVYHAVNDAILMSLMTPECWRGENVNLGLGSARDVVPEVDDELPWSVFQRYVGIQFGLMQNPLVINPFLRQGDMSSVKLCEGVVSDVEPGAVMNPPNYFERNLRNLVGVANTNDVEVVLSTWASYWSQEGDSGVDYIDATRDINVVTREIAASTDSFLIDLEAELPFNEAYWQADGIHQNANGTRAQAEIYAAALHESGLIPSADTVASSAD